MTIHNSLAELIGNTPLVKLNHIPQTDGVKATIAVKVEYFNPGGSSKDRIAESRMTGRPVVALCGKIWVPKHDPSKYPVCPDCKRLYDEMMR